MGSVWWGPQCSLALSFPTSCSFYPDPYPASRSEATKGRPVGIHKGYVYAIGLHPVGTPITSQVGSWVWNRKTKTVWMDEEF
ncbi:hypothetical protein B296_00016812 [Ensete ventricosum]|uniref:Uncharacterized protein n=1 Tax=Ensete ventricosum TaxID=4639 RepID=A0A427B333_ENSVE|nr:hypothetical protein B296_00016812 [Ensete ventricosum]